MRHQPAEAGRTEAPAGASAAHPVVAKILDAPRSLITIQDGHGRYVLVNAAKAEFHGLDRDTFLGRTPEQIVLPAGSLLGLGSADPVDDAEPVIARDVELSDATGRHRHFDIVRRTVRSGDRRSRYLIEVATETPDLATPEVAELGAAVAAIPAATFRCSVQPELCTTRIDDAAEQLFGLPAAELRGGIERLLAYALDGASEARRQRWQALAARAEPWDEELEILSARGESRWLRFAVRPAASSVGVEYHGVIVDVTARKAVEARLADAEERLELALENGGLGLVDWNLDTDRLASNRQLLNLLEVEDAELIGTAGQLSGFEHPKDKPRIRAELQAHLDGRSAEFLCEYRLRTARGDTRWVLASGQVVKRSPDGRALRYVGTLQDVTERLETERELERQLARSQQVTRMSTDLAREVKQLEAEIREISHREQERIGHDLHDGLGQELTGVSLMLKSLEHAIERDAPHLRPRVRSVRDMVEQCIATTRALAQGLSPVHLDRDGFAGALEQLAANGEALYGVPVTFSCDRRGVFPEHDAATDFYRIAQEAISNAAKHSGARSIQLGLMTDVDRIVVTIEDDGYGMPKWAESRGGMGLKIMRYRASIIGAALDIGPRDGGGTVVRCTLRKTPESSAPPAEKAT